MKVTNYDMPPFEWERLILLFKKLSAKNMRDYRHLKKLANNFPHYFEAKIPESPKRQYKEKYCVKKMFTKDRIVPANIKPIKPEKEVMELFAKHGVKSGGDLDRKRQVIAELREVHSALMIKTHYGDDFWHRYREFTKDERYLDLPGETWKPLVDEFGQPIEGYLYSSERRIASTLQTKHGKRIIKYQTRKTKRDDRKKHKPYKEMAIFTEGGKINIFVHTVVMWQEKPFGVGDNFPPSWTKEDKKEWHTLSESLKRKIMRGLTVDHINPNDDGYDPEGLQWMMGRDNSSKGDR